MSPYMKLLGIAGGSTFVYLILAILMGVLPGVDLSLTSAGAGVKPLTPLEAEGREVYVSNGCAYCHTQQVRPLSTDTMFGRPSAPGDFYYQTPELLGSERTGPDLTNIGVRQASEVWQYIHLYEPRSVVPESMMPSFKWLFKDVQEAPPDTTPVPVPKAFAPAHGVVIPTRQAQALVAYLLSLKQPPLAGSELSAFNVPPSSAKAPSVKLSSTETVLEFDTAEGGQLFSANCAACHQGNGEGIPGVFPPLKGNPAVQDDDPTQQIRVILKGLNGLKINGTAYPGQMPAFGSILSDANIAAIVDHERSSWGNHAKLVTENQVAAVRAKIKH